MLMKQKTIQDTNEGGEMRGHRLPLEVFDGGTRMEAHQGESRGHWTLPPARARRHGLCRRRAGDGTSYAARDPPVKGTT
jgi:hypothetical protein